MILLHGKNKLKGKINIISSKSYGHRALICGAFSNDEGKRYIEINEFSEDILTTINILKKIGINVGIKDNLVIFSDKDIVNKGDFFFNESGSTLRFFLPILASLGIDSTIKGEESLAKRPIKELIISLKKLGLDFSSETLPLRMKGKISNSNIEISADKTSQYLSAFLLTSPIIPLKEYINIYVNTEISSRGYIDITKDVMKDFSVNVIEKDNLFTIKEKEYRSIYDENNPYRVEGDWTNAYLYIVAALLSSQIEIGNLNINSVQGDRDLIYQLIDMGGNISFSNGKLIVKESKLKGGLIDIDKTPDLFPILSILATQTKEGIDFINFNRLRYKESDRIKSSLEMIEKLGGKIDFNEDRISIYPSKLKGGLINSYNDHRIQMAASIASILTDGIMIKNIRAYKKSYPSFYEDFKKLGGKYELVDR